MAGETEPSIFFFFNSNISIETERSEFPLTITSHQARSHPGLETECDAKVRRGKKSAREGILARKVMRPCQWVITILLWLCGSELSHTPSIRSTRGFPFNRAGKSNGECNNFFTGILYDEMECI